MFNNILIPFDLSERAHAALEALGSLPSAPDAVVRLLHVIETIQDVPFEELEGFYDGLRRTAEERMERFASKLAKRDFDLRREIVFGRRAPEIVRHAADEGCDLIVMHSHLLDLERLGAGFGTISHQVAVVAPCAVLLLR